MNVLKPARLVAALHALVEGCSVRAASRLTGVHKNTILKYLVDVGEHCQDLLDEELHSLPCITIEADEIWTFVGKKEARVADYELGLGDHYTYIGMDPASKLIAAHIVGRRTAETTLRFIAQLRERIAHDHLSLFTDGYMDYPMAVEEVYGADPLAHALVVRPESHVGMDITVLRGTPNPVEIGTSYVERQNLTMRQQLRRFTRRTLGFSKKLRNLRAAVALYVAWYNFVRFHSSVRMPPALALGITDRVWTLADLI